MASPPTTKSSPFVATPAPPLAGWLFPAYLGTIFAAAILLRLPGVMPAGQEMGGIRALFTAVNAATLTGFVQTTSIDTYQPLGQAAIFTLMVSGTLFTLTIAGTAMSRILRLGYSDTKILVASMVAEVTAIAGGAVVLLFDQKRTMGEAVFLAASAFGNCGLFVGKAPDGGAWQTHVGVLPLVALGGMGVCVLLEWFEYARGRRARLSEHAQAGLGLTAICYLAGILAIALLSWQAGSSLFQLLPPSAAAAVGARTAGLGLVAPGSMARPAVWGVIVLMVVGGCSGGVAGGIKLTTIFQISRGVRNALTGAKIGRIFGIAATWAAIYATTVFLAMLFLLHQLPETPADHVLFLAISAASNVGLAFEPLNPDRVTAFVLCAAMLIGRVGPLMVLWWTADSTKDVDVAVG